MPKQHFGAIYDDTLFRLLPWVVNIVEKTAKLSFDPRKVSICTDKKENDIFLICKETQMGSVAS
jgi:hypothetical protein